MKPLGGVKIAVNQSVALTPGSACSTMQHVHKSAYNQREMRSAKTLGGPKSAVKETYCMVEHRVHIANGR